MNSEYTYEPTDIEDEIFLAEVPVTILMSSIETQFDEPFEYRKKDYVQSFITKYEYLRDNNPDEINTELENMHDNFFAFIEKIFDEKLSVGFVDIDDMSEDDMHDLVHLTYRFFIKNIKKNFVNIIKNYINENQDIIEGNFEKKKDVTTLNFKAEIDNEYDVLVLSELGRIIDFVFDEVIQMPVDDFFIYCDDNEYYLELDFVKSKYNDMEITGNFIEKYLDMLTPEFKVEIQSKVRNKILQKYKKRERKIEIPDETDDELETEDGRTEETENTDSDSTSEE